MRCQLYRSAEKKPPGPITHYVLGPFTDDEWEFRETGDINGVCSDEMEEVGDPLELDDELQALAETNPAGFADHLRTQDKDIASHPIKVVFRRRPSSRWR